ncbi:subtilisin-like protein [Atractiella rhizophila]|nr:subtilisin-like protein [Atractiella rhizophila]
MLLSLLSALAISATSTQALFLTPNPNNFASANRNGYIVELAQDTSTTQALRQATPHKRFYNHLEARGRKFKVKHEYSNEKLFHGASVAFDEDITPEELLGLDGVVGVWPNKLYTSMDYELEKNLPSDLRRRVVENPLEGIKKREVKDPLEGIVKTAAKATYPHIPASDFKGDKFGPHQQIHASELHEKGILGKGIKVAVIDTGVDYLHPALGGGFGKGYKVSFGRDLVGDNYGDGSDPVPDNDPYDTCGSHGSHVSGIVAADPNPYNFTGVAPQADLGHYRIFSCKGPYTSTDLIIQALISAFQDGADVITLSLGGVSGWQSDPGSVVAERINELGRITTIAAGNAGNEGLFYASSPAGAQSVWSIASIESPSLYETLAHSNTGPSLASMPLRISNVADDGCAPFQIPSYVNLNKTAVIIKRGTCFIDDKLKNAAAAGAKFILIANNDGAPFYAGTNAALVSTEDGEFLRKRFRENKKTTVDFTDTATVTVANPGAGYPSSFTNYGPTFDMLQQPSFAAPGGQILSTYPLRLGGYAIISGTSMATPAAAGAAALFLSQRKKENLSPVHIRSIFSSTANYQYLSASAANVISPVIQSGSGLIDVSKAVNSKIVLEPSQLALNDTRYFKAKHTIKITNVGLTPKTYKVSHKAASAVFTYNEDETDYISTAPQFAASPAAQVSFSKSSITVAPLVDAELTVTFKKPAVNERFPVYSGLILLTSGSEELKIPYFGVANELYDVPIIDHSTGVEKQPPPLLWTKADPVKGVDANGTTQIGSETYTFSGTSYPALIFRLLFGTPRLSVDLVHANTTFVPTIEDPYNSEKTTPSNVLLRTRATTPYDSVPIVGNIPSLSGDYLSRDSSTGDEQLVWDGTITASGSTVNAPNGSYRLLMRALKMTGNPKIEEDYESWLSPIVTIQRS